MNGLKEALEFVVGLRKPEIFDIDGNKYSDKELCRVKHNPKAAAIVMTTLSSFIDYVKSNVDVIETEKMIVHVVSPTKVLMYSCLDEDRTRENLVEVRAQIPDFDYGQYMDHENFLIALQSKFLKNEDRDLLLKFAGTVRSGSVAEYGDDGVSQKATVKSGVSSVTDAVVPNPVSLAPYRTFIEVAQPESSFVFRMREYDSRGVQCAIFEADGGAWKNCAMERIRDYLFKGFEENGIKITVIS